MIELREASVVVRTAGEDVTVLTPTTVTIPEGLVAVIGANGSGKSTFARLLNGLVEPSSGSVLVDGLDTRREGKAVRRKVGFVFTDPNAQLVMPTVVEDVALSLRREHRNPKDRHRAALGVLERFGLAHLATRSVHTLSGGQKQLLAIASVLAVEPALVVADEPTTLLDLRNSRMIGDLLCSLSQQVVIVTHDLNLAARAERVIVIDEGAIAFDGDPDTAIAGYRALA